MRSKTQTAPAPAAPAASADDAAATPQPAEAASSSSFRADPFNVLTAHRVRSLRRERLEPLSKWVSMRMDMLWGEIGAAEAGGRPPAEVNEMRLRFTHLHVAVDVAARAVECAALVV